MAIYVGGQESKKGFGLFFSIKLPCKITYPLGCKLSYVSFHGWDSTMLFLKVLTSIYFVAGNEPGGGDTWGE